jgi:hypothetical protein
VRTYKTKRPDGQEIHVSEAELAKFASDAGLDAIAVGRYSKLFVFKLLLYTKVEGTEPAFILEELKALESLPNNAIFTKPPTQFTRQPLRGLWHKHFFDARFVPNNIAIHMQGKRLEETVKRIFDHAKSPTVTKGMIEELAQAVSHGALQEREGQGKLTGEWIVFAKDQGKNYYLTLATHTEGDQQTFDEIRNMAYSDFAFLATS